MPANLKDKTIVVKMNYSGPIIKVAGYPKANPNVAVTVTFDMKQND